MPSPLSTLKEEKACFSETLVPMYMNTHRHSPNGYLNVPHRENTVSLSQDDRKSSHPNETMSKLTVWHILNFKLMRDGKKIILK
jgi:hypothetical protein